MELLIDDAEFETFKAAYIACTIEGYAEANPYRAKVVSDNIEQMFRKELHSPVLFKLWCEAKRQAFAAANKVGK